MNYDDWKLASPPENGDVSPCCGDPEYSESEDDEGPASCSQEVPRRSRAAWLCTLSPVGLWGGSAF